MKRVFIIVLDSCGIGQMPDAENFSDKNCNTLKRISESKNFCADNMIKLGLGNIQGIDYLEKVAAPTGAYARLAEKSMGKDTTIGHWEIAGLVSDTPFPVYKTGFPKEIIDEFSRATGRGVICNKPYSGTKVIADYGERHVKSGDLIVYTSADSVFQIAAHEDVVPTSTLYEYCRIARKILCGKHAVGRVIARPFTGTAGRYTRTANRKDFSLEPPRDTMLDVLKKAGKTVWCIGKISDIFAGRSVTKSVTTHSDKEGINATLEAINQDFSGLCFVNLVEFDMLYGHRQDIDGYAANFARFDNCLPKLLSVLKEDDVLIITADHGCDPGDESTDHTREYVPLIVYGKNIKPINLGTRESFADISAFVCEYLGVEFVGDSKSFLGDVYDR